MTYTCKICNTTSDTSEFYSGVTSRCKNCHKSKMREARAENVEHYKAYDALRFKNDPRVAERHRRYQKTDAGKAAMAASREKWMKANQSKRAAHIILGNAVRCGRIKRPSVCEVCNFPSDRIEGHHTDYAFPLSVVWCCRSCHVALHKKEA